MPKMKHTDDTIKRVRRQVLKVFADHNLPPGDAFATMVSLAASLAVTQDISCGQAKRAIKVAYLSEKKRLKEAGAM